MYLHKMIESGYTENYVYIVILSPFVYNISDCNINNNHPKWLIRNLMTVAMGYFNAVNSSVL